MKARIGILSGKEYYCERLIDTIHDLGGGEVVAQPCEVDAMPLGAPCPYRVIVDRISHASAFYLEYAKNALLRGAVVINNPYRFFSDKAFGYQIAEKLGVAVPRTVTLPQFAYDPQMEPEDLHNLKYPLDWQAIVDYVGFPAVLKPAAGYAWRDVSVVNSLSELLYSYHQTRQEVMVLQEFIEFDTYVRCFVYGRKYTLPVKYDPRSRRYLIEHEFLTPPLGERIDRESRLLSEVFDYDMNTCEWAIRNGVPYAIDFNNLVPDSKRESVTPFYFERILEYLARTAIEYALDPEASSSFWSRSSSLSRWARGELENPCAPLYGGKRRDDA